MDEKMTVNRGTYKVIKDCPCCENCAYSFRRMGISLLCSNSEEWVMEAGVEPLGLCDSFKFKDNEETRPIGK